MHPEPVVVYTALGSGPAQILRGLLEASGIPVQLLQEGAGAAYGLTVGPLGEVRVLVPPAYAGEARAIVSEFDPSYAREAGAEDDEP